MNLAELSERCRQVKTLDEKLLGNLKIQEAISVLEELTQTKKNKWPDFVKRYLTDPQVSDKTQFSIVAFFLVNGVDPHLILSCLTVAAGLNLTQKGKIRSILGKMTVDRLETLTQWNMKLGQTTGILGLPSHRKSKNHPPPAWQRNPTRKNPTSRVSASARRDMVTNGKIPTALLPYFSGRFRSIILPKYLKQRKAWSASTSRTTNSTKSGSSRRSSRSKRRNRTFEHRFAEKRKKSNPLNKAPSASSGVSYASSVRPSSIKSALRESMEQNKNLDANFWNDVNEELEKLISVGPQSSDEEWDLSSAIQQIPSEDELPSELQNVLEEMAMDVENSAQAILNNQNELVPASVKSITLFDPISRGMEVDSEDEEIDTQALVLQRTPEQIERPINEVVVPEGYYRIGRQVKITYTAD